LVNLFPNIKSYKSSTWIICFNSISSFFVFFLNSNLTLLASIIKFIKPSKLEIDVKGSGFCQIQFTCNGKFQQSLRRTPNLISLCIKNNKNIHNTDDGIINDEKVDKSNYSRSNNKPDDLEHDILQNNKEDENDCDSKFQISQINNNTIEYPAARKIDFIDSHYVTPATHFVYAITWFSLAIAGLGMTYYTLKRPTRLKKINNKKTI
jgi:hypothetical protein